MSKEPSITLMRDALAHAGPQEVLQDIAQPNDDVYNWLSRLVLLSDIPFQHIVADSRLLPKNSLRFFYVDPSWLNALIDGALSINSNTTLETQFTKVMAEPLRDRSGLKARSMRSNLLGLNKLKAPVPEVSPVPTNLISGLMLRSELVSAFPGLKIIPEYPGGATNDAPLRYETIGTDLTLIIFPAVPETITIQQPPHGLQFGVADGDTATQYTLYLRNIAGANTGEQLLVNDEPVSVTVSTTGANALFRTGGKNVLDINTLKNTLQTSLKNNNAFPASSTVISPSQFVMQLLKTPEQAIYTNSLNTPNQ